MPLRSASSSNIQNDTISKKTFRKVNKSNYHNLTSSNANEELKEEISVKSSTSSKEKFEKISITQSNQGSNFLKETGKEQDLKGLTKGKPFTTTLQDFPELKVCNDSSSSKFNAGNNRIGYNKSWGDKWKKNEDFPSFSSVIVNIKTKSDTEKKKLIQNTGNNIAGSCGENEKLSETYLNTENIKENNDLISVKQISNQSKRNPNKKKRSDPVLINLDDILIINKNIKRSQKFPKRRFQRRKDTEHLSGNYLDSSNPKRLRGKRREVKKKTLTSLKLAIIKERIIKQKLREKSTAAYLVNENVNFINNIDFKSEIKIYLKELNEKKLKQAESNQNKISKNYNSGRTNNEINSCDKNKKVDKIIPSITPEGNFKFSSKFREYCDNIITPDLNSAVSNLIKASVNLQDKSFLRDPIKAKARKRHVSGIREVKKYLTLKKAKLIIIAPNLEKLQMEGSLHDVINDLKSTAQAQNVTYAFALDRYKLGRYTKKNLPVSAFAILNYEGIEELFYNVLEILQKAKAQFSEMVKPNSEKEEYIKTAEINSKVIASIISGFQTELKIDDEKNDSD